MDNFEKVEKLREKTGVSYEEAKNALEASNYDLLDAMIYLEQLGKVSSSGMASYTTSSDSKPSEEFALAQKTYEQDCNKTTFGDVVSKILRWCGKVIKKGCDTSFQVVKEGKEIMTIPVIVLVLVGLIALPLTLVLLIVGLFCNCKYYFIGFKDNTLNDICDKASETCNNIKNDLKDK